MRVCVSYCFLVILMMLDILSVLGIGLNEGCVSYVFVDLNIIGYIIMSPLTDG